MKEIFQNEFKADIIEKWIAGIIKSETLNDIMSITKRSLIQ